MSGAQVVPIFAYSNQSYFDNLLPKINGVLFPGIYLIIKEEMLILILRINGPATPTIF